MNRNTPSLPPLPEAWQRAPVNAVSATIKQPRPSTTGGHGGHGGHGWMMMICCIPMLVIAVALVATGTASAGFLVTALLCTAMMALMMRGMNHGSSPNAPHNQSSSSDDHDHHRSPSS